MTPYADTRDTYAVVIGSRSFDGNEDAEAWIDHEIECVADHADVLVTGDAIGVDARVRLFGERTGVRVIRYHLDGTVRDATGILGRWADGPRHPFARNEAKIRAVALRVRDQGSASVHAMFDPFSRTGGTRNTVKHARKYRLRVYESTYDAAAWDMARREGFEP